jgi:selenide,water dikinase
MSDIDRLSKFSKGGGCGCKISPALLQQILHTDERTEFSNLLVGYDTRDDAAVYRINETEAIISTTDFFLPIVDDPFDFGRIAAANSISDVYAMGGVPIMALAILGIPIDKFSVETIQQIMEGGRLVCKEANIPMAGGHTIDSADPIFGLAVTGRVALQNLKRNTGAQKGDLLFLTKPLGTGILATALKRELLQSEHYTELIVSMTTLNSIGAELAKEPTVRAMTDITGFGLLGHALEIAEGSLVGMELHYSAIKRLAGTEHYLQQRTIPDATYRNWNAYSSKVGFEKGVNVMEAFNLLPDPQTNGGLLVAVQPAGVEALKNIFLNHGLENYCSPIGLCTELNEKTIVVKS